MGGVVPALMLTELKSPTRETYAVLELDLKPLYSTITRITNRFGMTGTNAIAWAGGTSVVFPWVQEFGDMTRSVGLTEPGLRVSGTSVKLVDQGDFFRNLLRGS